MYIKELRKLTGLTQESFSKKYKIPRRSVQNWESGTRECPEYVYDLLRYRVLDDFVGRKWSSLNDKQKDYLISTAECVDGKNGNKPTHSSDCIVDFACGLSITGHFSISEIEDVITIDDEATLYDSSR